MKQRTFLTTLLLFLFFFNLGIFIVSVFMFQGEIKRAKERSLGEHYFITSAMIKDFNALKEREVNIDESINLLLQPYEYLLGDSARIALYKEEELVYFSQEEIVSMNRLLKAPEGGDRLVTIQKSDGRSYAIVYGRLPAPHQSYLLIYTHDITNIIKSWSHLKNLLFFAGLVLSIFLALGLMLVLNRIFRPLMQISQTSKDIANGEYDTRLLVPGQDELSEMAQSFNHMAEEIQRQMTELRDVAKKKQQFVDNFAHELRTPLTAIYGYAEYMQKAVISEDERLSALGYIMSESSRLQKVAYQLLELANLQNNQIAFEELKVRSLFEMVRKTLFVKYMGKGIQIIFEGKIKTIRGDAYLMESLLINLVDNAAKACGKDGLIIITALMEEENKVIKVQDNGKGMDAKTLAQITEPFYRADKSRNSNDGGAGLGLSLCKQIALSHNAKLGFVSQLGKGTTAKITFTT